jgi:hypothetical protein
MKRGARYVRMSKQTPDYLHTNLRLIAMITITNRSLEKFQKDLLSG